MNAFKDNLKALFLLLAIGLGSASFAQEAKEKKGLEVKALLESKEFVFKARSATPAGGGYRQLTTDYDLRILGDTVQSFLPYFGRAYVAPIGNTEGGIRFTSKEFDYEVKDRKKGRWNVLIRPKDVSDVRQMFLSVSENGYASLQVISNNRQPISFDGRIAERTIRK